MSWLQWDEDTVHKREPISESFVCSWGSWQNRCLCLPVTCGYLLLGGSSTSSFSSGPGSAQIPCTAWETGRGSVWNPLSLLSLLSLLTGLCIFELPLLLCTHRDSLWLKIYGSHSENVQQSSFAKTPLYKKILQILIISSPIMNFGQRSSRFFMLEAKLEFRM